MRNTIIPIRKDNPAIRQNHIRQKEEKHTIGEIGGKQYLANHLWMSRYSGDASFPQVQLGFVYCRDFQEIKGRRIQEEKRNEGRYPYEVMHAYTD